MPLGDVVAGLFELIGRFFGQVFIEIFLEIIVRGPGYLIARLFSGSKNTDPDGWLALLLGIAFWAVIAAGAYFVFQLTEDPSPDTV